MLNESQETPVKSLSEAEKRELLRRLNHRKKEVREETLREITASAEALPRLLELHEAEKKRSKRLHFRLLLPVSGLQTFSFSLTANHFSGWKRAIVFLSGFGGALLCAAILQSVSRTTALSLLSDAICKCDDVRALPFFIATVENTALNGSQEEMLHRLLGLLRMKDSGLLQERHRKFLNRYLLRREEYNAFLKVAILEAYQQVGDESALQTVERLIAQRVGEYNGREERVHCAAEECLPYLQRNLGHVTQIQHLLRPSSPPEKQEELLRPARDIKEDKALLRASDSPK